jgi:hypothetical protein
MILNYVLKLEKRIAMDHLGLSSFKNTYRSLSSIKEGSLIFDITCCLRHLMASSKLTGFLKDTSALPLHNSISRKAQISTFTSQMTRSKSILSNMESTRKVTRSAMINFKATSTKTMRILNLAITSSILF